MRLALSAAVALGLSAVGLAQASRPLPDPAAFQREVRARLQIDDFRQRDYIYTATQRTTNLDGAGRVTSERLKVVESYPGLPGEPRWDRVLVEDGKPLSDAELAEQDRERKKEADAYLRKQARLTRAQAEAERLAREDERREQAAMLDDAFRVFAFKIVGREFVGDHETVVVTMTPQRDVKTRTRQGGWAKHFKGRAWIHETDYELVKVEMEAIDTLSVGFGMLARIHEGSKVLFERRRMEDGAWLPARSSLSASARFFLLRRYRMNVVTEYSKYRRARVDTSTSYAVPQ